MFHLWRDVLVGEAELVLLPLPLLPVQRHQHLLLHTEVRLQIFLCFNLNIFLNMNYNYNFTLPSSDHTYLSRAYHCSSVKKGNLDQSEVRMLRSPPITAHLNLVGTLVSSSIWATRSCFSMAKLWRKLPPNTRLSSGVYTAWIQPLRTNRR